MYEKLKRFLANDTVFTCLVICGVAVLAFVLGRLSVTAHVSRDPQAQPAAVRLVSTTPVQPSSSAVSPQGSPEVELVQSGQYIASKTGSKYHRITCPGAKQIKPANAVYFASAAEAEAAGYSKALNCPGL